MIYIILLFNKDLKDKLKLYSHKFMNKILLPIVYRTFHPVYFPLDFCRMQTILLDMNKI